MKMKAKKAPTENGFYLYACDDDHDLNGVLSLYYKDGRYAFLKKFIDDPENSQPIEDLTKHGWWRFFGPINPTGMVTA